jgi:hypothetical protein
METELVMIEIKRLQLRLDKLFQVADLLPVIVVVCLRTEVKTVFCRECFIAVIRRQVV